MWKNPSKSAVSDMLRSARLTPAAVPHSHREMVVLSVSACLNALSRCHATDYIFALTKVEHVYSTMWPVLLYNK